MSKQANPTALKTAITARSSGDGRYVFFLRKPSYELTRSEKKKEVKKEKMTKDDFFIFDVKDNRIIDSVQRVMKFWISKNASDWVVIQKHKD